VKANLHWQKNPTLLLMSAMLMALVTASCGSSGGSNSSEEPLVLEEPPPPINNAPLPVGSSLTCTTGTLLTWQNFGEPFMLNYCSSCHAAESTGADRNGAPVAATFDTAADITRWRTLIAQRATGDGGGRPMPPSGHVPAEEKQLLTEWLGCGAPID